VATAFHFTTFLLASGGCMILAFIGSVVSKIGQGLFSGPAVRCNNIIVQLNPLNFKQGGYIQATY